MKKEKLVKEPKVKKKKKLFGQKIREEAEKLDDAMDAIEEVKPVAQRVHKLGTAASDFIKNNRL